VIDATTNADRAKEKVDIATIQSVPGFEKITKEEELWERPEKIKFLISHLQAKPQATQEEKAVLEYIQLKNEQGKALIMAQKNMSESEYEKRKKSGEIQDFVLAENLIGPVDREMTMEQLNRRLNEQIEKTVFASVGSNESKRKESFTENIVVDSKSSHAQIKNTVDSLRI